MYRYMFQVSWLKGTGADAIVLIRLLVCSFARLRRDGYGLERIIAQEQDIPCMCIEISRLKLKKKRKEYTEPFSASQGPEIPSNEAQLFQVMDS